ncbi:MAG: hypothetical protein GY712_01915, partial [Oceanicoccus sp.]|uniref:transposase n=1 Tax=Oceanicoccus sp. TaxID=2691044 RepID=UPI00336E1FB0|nr:hypothetical protein [Oceanicoccus sp.]
MYDCLPCQDARRHETQLPVTTRAKWLEMLLAHIPDKGEHTVRYYGYYSNRKRGERRLVE